VKTRRLKQDNRIARRSKLTTVVLPALLAVGGSLAATQAAALELGELQVQSKLGQPLRASIAFVLAPNEIIAPSCVSLRATGSGLPAVSETTVSIANGVISLTGRSVIREPLLTANFVVDCPYTPHVSRDLMLFLYPMDTPAYAGQAAPVVVPARPAAAAQQPRTEPPARVAAATTAPIEQATRYRVVPGDSLSAIAGRLQGREVGLQAAMTAIFEINPDAFLGNDPNLLQAGSWLDIPSFAGGVVAPQTSATVQAPPLEYAGTDAPAVDTVAATTIDTTTDATVYDGAGAFVQESADEPAVTESLTEAVPDEPVEAVPEPRMAPASADVAEESQSAYADLLPGDVVMDDSLVADSEQDVSIADPTTASPAVDSERRVRGTQIIGAPKPAESSWDWLIWLAAGGISLFAGFLMFGQRLRERFVSKPVGATASTRPQSAEGTPRVAPIVVPDSEIAVEEIKSIHDDVDFDLSDDSPTEENLALDADLIAGTGLEQSTDVDVNQDFGFAVTTELDMELPELAGRENQSPETDIIPPPERTQTDMVVDSEVLPDDTEYEMSVLMDATKMPNPNDVTERDLKAVAVEDNGQTLIGDNYSINQEIDLEVLEKDYEDEFTATQALNEEIEKAAAELAETVDPVVDPVVDSSADTSVEMQLTDIADLDVTAAMEAQNDEIGEDDITARIEADDETVEMPPKDRTKAS
jgi:hypothetical protein